MENLATSDTTVGDSETIVELSDSDKLMDESEAPGDCVKEKETSPQQSTCIKALNDGHSTLKANLQRTLSELSEKEDLVRDLEEDAVRQSERSWLLEERIRLMTEKLCCYKRCLEREEKKQDDLFMELAEAKWKSQESTKYLEKLKNDYLSMQSKKEERKKELQVLEGHHEEMKRSEDELQQDIQRLTNYKLLLQRGDTQACAILNGNKMIELEQRKRALQDAIEERSARSESLYVAIDEKADRVQQLKKSLEYAKKRHQIALRDRQNRYMHLAETELRLQRSLDYLRSKIDYGTYKPAPWPNIRESLKFKLN